MKVECEICLYRQPNLEAFFLSPKQWRHPQHYECAFGNEEWPGMAHFCMEFKLEARQAGKAASVSGRMVDHATKF